MKMETKQFTKDPEEVMKVSDLTIMAKMKLMDSMELQKLGLTVFLNMST